MNALGSSTHCFINVMNTVGTRILKARIRGLQDPGGIL